MALNDPIISARAVKVLQILVPILENARRLSTAERRLLESLVAEKLQIYPMNFVRRGPDLPGFVHKYEATKQWNPSDFVLSVLSTGGLVPDDFSWKMAYDCEVHDYTVTLWSKVETRVFEARSNQPGAALLLATIRAHVWLQQGEEI